MPSSLVQPLILSVALVTASFSIPAVVDSFETSSSMGPFSHLRVVAAGRGRSMCLPPIVDKVLDLAQGGRPVTEDATLRLLYLGTATYDEDDAFQAQTHAYSSRTAPPYVDVKKLDVSECVPIDQLPSKDDMSTHIQTADIIMVSGGNTLYAVNRWKQLGMDRMIRQRVGSPSGEDTNGRVVLCGGSAGAIAWFSHGHSDSMDPTTFLNVDPHLTDEQKADWSYIRVDGLGYIPNTLCVPHYDATQSNGLPRTQDSDEMLRQAENKHLVCVGIDENAAFVVNDGYFSVVAGGSNGGGGDSTSMTSECCHVKIVQDDGQFFHQMVRAEDPAIPIESLIDTNHWKSRIDAIGKSGNTA
mmetsp:Transcript_14287/g.40651  ORF Transcript_14287/g.40651 Transcript_14287/m.40651 type:complete len:356 (-) Transcript_14287:29-1096(-)